MPEPAGARTARARFEEAEVGGRVFVDDIWIARLERLNENRIDVRLNATARPPRV